MRFPVKENFAKGKYMVFKQINFSNCSQSTYTQFILEKKLQHVAHVGLLDLDVLKVMGSDHFSKGRQLSSSLFATLRDMARHWDLHVFLKEKFSPRGVIFFL